MSNRLKIYLFGKPTFHLDNAPNPIITSRKALALLIYLVTTKKEHPREVLAEMLWEGRSQTQSMANLRVLLTRLRQSVGSFLKVTRESVFFNLDSDFWLDVDEMESHLTASAEVRSIKGELHSDAAEEITQAIALYQADFLEGFYVRGCPGFETWVREERERLRRMYLQGLRDLVSFLITRSEYPQGIKHARKCLQVDPLSESAHRQLMTLYALNGQRSAALQQYETCRCIIRDELDAEPSRITEELLENIKTGEFGRQESAFSLTEVPERTIRGYKLGDQIGRGSCGVVYSAHQPHIQREVAVKIFFPQHANQAEFIRRFDFETQRIARLEHLHIVPLYDYWREPSGTYLVMRLMRGGSLGTHLRDGPLDLDDAYQILKQIGDALDVAHQRGIIHGNLKPTNILFGESENAYLSDFSVTTPQPAFNQSKAVIESLFDPDYLAPEQVQGGLLVPQTDIYSLGILLFEILTGVHPFSQTPSSEMPARHIKDSLPPLRMCNPNLPTELDRVIQHATAKRQEKRYTDVSALLTDFQEVSDSYRSRSIVVSGIPEETIREIRNPYKGLNTFQEADAPDFFGRERAVEKLIARLGEGGNKNRFLALVGPSGCGKSSLIRAGLIPAIRNGALPGSERWFIIAMMPGVHPMEALETALMKVAVSPPPNMLRSLKEDSLGLVRMIDRVLPAPKGADQNRTGDLLLLIDQFEEIFTRVPDEATRLHFLDSLQEAIAVHDSCLWVLITLRADFYDRPLQYGEFGELLRTRTEVILPMDSHELLQSITGPAARVGVEFEPGMAVAIATDIADQPGALPLLQYALTELFDRREGMMLSQDVYEEIGGVSGALARRAEETYTTLDTESQGVVRQLFLRLITLGEDVEDTRRRVLRTELTSLRLDSQFMDIAISSFGKARLLTFDRDPETRGPTVEVAHEALLREWPRLRDWLDRSRADIRTQRVLANAVSEWRTSGEDPSFLLRGSRLGQYENWAKNTDLVLTVDEQAYLESSLEERERRHAADRARRERERMLERRAIQRLRIAVAVLVSAIVLAVALAGTIFWQSQGAQRVAEERLSVALATNAERVFNEGLRDLGIALALEANYIKDPPPQVQRALANLAFAPGTRRVFDGYIGKITALDTSSDGRYLLFGPGVPLDEGIESDFALHMWKIESGEEVRRFEGHTAPVNVALFSPDGKTIISGGADNVLFWWDVGTGKVKENYAFPSVSGVIGDLAFHPDGDTVIVQYGKPDLQEVYLQRLDLSTGEILQTYESNADAVAGIAFSPDGSYLNELSCVTDGDCSVVIWDVDLGKLISSKTSFDLTELEPTSMALSPDGESAIVGGKWGNVGLVDIHSGNVIHILKAPNISQPTEAVDFNPNGRTALAGFFDGRVCHFEVSSGDEMYCIKGHTDHVWAIKFTQDGTQAVSTSYDGSIRLWDLTSGNEVLRFAPDDVAGFWGLILSPDGKTAFSGAGAYYFDLPEPGGDVEGIDYVPPVENNTVIIWDTDTGEEINRLDGHMHSVWSFALHPDGRHLLSGARWEGICLWDLESGDLLQYFPDKGGMTNVTFNQDGSQFLYGSWDGTQHLVDLESGDEIQNWDFPYGAGVGAVEFEVGGRTIFSGMWEGELTRLSLDDGQEILRFIGHTGPIWQIHLLPDRERMLSFASDTTARLWDLESGEEIHRFVLDEFGVASALTSDGKLLFLSSTDVLKNSSILTLWDLESREQIARYSQEGIVWEAAFSPDGRFFYTSAWDGTVRKWLVPPQEIDELVRWVLINRYVPQLSPEQRKIYLLDPQR
jgi:WD40 repeat protein/serine/threonine protein kinase/DNA-binding SARP family transcriptional activator